MIRWFLLGRPFKSHFLFVDASELCWYSSMAACSSSIGFSVCMNLRNEAVSGMIWGHNLIVGKAEMRYFVREVALPVFPMNSGNRHFYRKKKQRHGVMSMLEPEAELQSGFAETPVTKDVTDNSVRNTVRVSETGFALKTDGKDGGEDMLDSNGGNGNFPNGRGGGGGGGGADKNDGDDSEEEEFGPLLCFEEVMRETQARGASLPSDMLTAAKNVGIRKILLLRYLDLQVLIQFYSYVFLLGDGRSKEKIEKCKPQLYNLFAPGIVV